MSVLWSITPLVVRFYNDKKYFKKKKVFFPFNQVFLKLSNI